MSYRQKSISQKVKLLALAGVAAIALNACASPRGHSGGTVTPDFSSMSNAAKHAAVQDLGAKYQQSPSKQSAIYFAAALRAIGQTGQAVSVLEQARLKYKDDSDVALAYAKALAADGKFNRAINVLDATIRPERPSWNALSVKGAVYDQMGQNAQARTLYNQALVIAPNEPSLYANLGLSYAMSNQLDQAESALRRAVSLPKANSKVRLNLALVVGLQAASMKRAAFMHGNFQPKMWKPIWPISAPCLHSKINGIASKAVASSNDFQKQNTQMAYKTVWVFLFASGSYIFSSPPAYRRL